MLDWNFWRGAVRSKTVWWNIVLTVLGSLELVGAHLTTLLGPKMSAAILLVGALVNIVLRKITTMSLTEKAVSKV